MDQWPIPAIQGHPELVAGALGAYLLSALVLCSGRKNAPQPGTAPMITALAALVGLAPILAVGTAVFLAPNFAATYGHRAARAQALGAISGLAALVAVFGLSVYPAVASARNSRRRLARAMAEAKRRPRREGSMIALETAASLAAAIWAIIAAK